ncbi:MAG TPA: ABC transporter permease [Solirubrobacteraceae bacterium]|jgi:peptide/nickel transport system permease protein|nr:ABC transporter permease [Solirubrobacteraceae bacterium]
MHRFGFLVRRALQIVPLLAVVLFVVAALVRVVPGDPARALLGLGATPARAARLDQELGVDKPLLSGYVDYASHAIQGNLGNSVKAQEPVTTLIGERVGVTAWLLFFALLFALLLALPLAILSARRRDRPLDHGIRGVSVLALSIPTFWLGLMLVSYVALPTGWFPVAGFGEGLAQHLHSIVLPALALALAIAPIQIRALRVALIRALNSDFVAAARAMGLNERRVLLRHALPNAMVSSLTLLAAQLGALLFGEVVVESAFALPGLGQAMVQAVSERDYAVVQGITLLAALLVILVNLAVDVLYALLDPRVQVR